MVLFFEDDRSPEGLPRVNTSDIFPDPWAMRVYALHRSNALDSGVNICVAEGEAIIASVAARWGLPAIPIQVCNFSAPALEFDERTGFALRVLIPREKLGELNVGMILHEVAHYLAVRLFQRETHGPLFVGVLATVHAWHFGLDAKIVQSEFVRAMSLSAFPLESIERLRVLTSRRPLDVEDMREFVRGLKAVDPKVIEYYKELPDSVVLGSKISAIYSAHGAPAPFEWP